MIKVKKKKCGYSKCPFEDKYFTPFRSTQKTHNNALCAYGYVQENKEELIEEIANEEVRIIKEKQKDRSYYLKKLVAVFHTFIRLRDKDLPCISCGTTKDVEYHAGHFWPAGNYSFLRFNEHNVNKQCGMNCNKQKHGNIAEYEIGLRKKIGIEAFEKLANDRHKKLDLTIDQIKELIIIYKNKVKEYDKN